MSTILVTGARGNIGARVVARHAGKIYELTVAALLGKPARTFRQWASENRETFQPEAAP